MRISTAYAYDRAMAQLQERQGELAQTQVQLTSGKQVLRPSDDPVSAARAERAMAAQMRAESNLRAVDSSRTAMTQTEAALGDATELMQQARELIINAGNASLGDSERASIGERLRSIREQLLAVANRPNGQGGYLFSAQGSAAPPFVNALPVVGVATELGGVAYSGVAGNNVTADGSGLPLTADGRAVFMSGRTGNGVFETSAGAGVQTSWIDGGQVVQASTYFGIPPSDYSITVAGSGASATWTVVRTPLPPAAAVPVTVVNAQPAAAGAALSFDGISVTLMGTLQAGDSFSVKPSQAALNVFGVLDKAANDLISTGLSSAQRTQNTMENLRNLDQSLSLMIQARSAAGEALGRADNETNRLEGQSILAQTERSKAEDLDLVQAVSDFQNQQTGYDAALKAYSMVQRMSLLQYL